MSLEDEIAEIDNLLQEVRERQVRKVNGTVLSTALELIYKCGLELKEVPEIKVNSLKYNDDNELENITLPGQSPIAIPEEVKELLQEYLTYLTGKGYPSTPEAPLFPGYENTKQVKRHLEKFSKEIGARRIHKVGIKRHYFALIKDGASPKEALERTARQFDIEEREVGDVIEDKIQPAGRPKPIETDSTKLMDFIKRTEWLGSKEDAKELTREFLDFINENIKIAKTILSEKDKVEWNNIFINTIDSKLIQLKKEAAEKSRQQEQEKKPLREVIKDFINSETE